LGDLNVDFDRLDDARADVIAAQMVLLALNDVGDHFTHPRGQWTWSQVREGRYICSKTDYIMAQEILDFKLGQSRFLGLIQIIVLLSQRFDLVRCMFTAPMSVVDDPFFRSPLQRPLTQNDVRFQELKQNKDLPDPWKERDRSWISKKTWDLINARVYAVRWKYPREQIQEYSKAIRKSLCVDRRRRCERVSKEIEEKYIAGNIRGAYELLRG
jgi:hypothetical protein